MGMVGATTSRQQMLIAIVVSGIACGALGWWSGNSGPAASGAADAGEVRVVRGRTVVEVVEVPGEERVVVVEREGEDGPGAAAPDSDVVDVDPAEDYARYGDGPSASAMSKEEVMEHYLAEECVDAGKECTSDLQCCGAAICRPPQGSIGGIFRCRES